MKSLNLSRALSIESDSTDSRSRSVSVSVSSEYPVHRSFAFGDYDEILSHAANAVDLSRAPLPVIESHDSSRLNIGLIESLRLVGKRLIGVLRLGESARALEVWRDIEAGIVRSLSIGYQIQEYEIRGETLFVTRWQPYEISLVAVAADPTIGINRSMTTETTTQETTTTSGNVTPITEATRAIELERQRVDAINTAFDRPSLPRNAEFNALRLRALQAGWTEKQSNQAILAALGEMSEGVVDHSRTTDDMLGIHHEAQVQRHPRPQFGRRVEHGESRAIRGDDDFLDAATDALCQRAGIALKNPHPAARDLSRMSIQDMTRTLISRQDRQSGWLSPSGWFGRGSGATASDFTHLLTNVANKAVLHLMSEQEHSWRPWTRTIEVPDLKPQSLVGLGAFSDLDEIPDSGEYKQGTVVDWSESVSVLTYGKNFGLTRKALINDDLGQFANLSRQFAASASRKIAQLAFGRLTANPVLVYDSTAVFHANHANLASSGAAPSVSTLDAGISAMRLQQAHMRDTDDSDPVYLNIQPKFLLVPVGLEMTAKIILASGWYPTDAGMEASPLYGKSPLTGIELISDPLLDANSTTAWYLVADPTAFDGVVVATLASAGNSFGLTIESFEPDHQSDTYWQKVRIDVGASAVDYRTLYKNPGA